MASPDDALRQIDARIAQVSADWATRFLQQRKAALDKRDIRAGGQLADSLAHGIEKGGEAGVVSILIAFNDYGRIVEMRRVQHDKWGRNAVSRVEDWIREKGVSRFVPGFMAKYRLKTVPKDFIHRAAWGVLVSRSQGKFRRRAWWNKAKTASITNLYNDVAVATADIVADEVKFSFEFNKYAQRKGRE